MNESPTASGSIEADAAYEAWLARHALTPVLRAQIRAEIARWQNPPKISVVMPVINARTTLLVAAIESVRCQLYPHWDLWIVEGCTAARYLRRILEKLTRTGKTLQEYARKDPRIHLEFRHSKGDLSALTNSALQSASGEFLAFVDSDDECAEHALFRVAQEIVRHPDIDWIYTDEDRLSPEGRRVAPFFKPDWSPDYLLSWMYTGHLSVYRTSVLRAVGGMRLGYDAAQDYDLALRIMTRTNKVRHIPDVLYHRRITPESSSASSAAVPTSETVSANRRAIEDYLQSTGTAATVEEAPNPIYHRVRYTIQGHPLVSIVMATASRPVEMNGRSTWFALECVRSIRQLTTYPNIEIIIVDNDDMPAELATALEPLRVKCVHYTQPFNYSAKVNLGTRHARGDYVVFLNDDIEVITPDWIEGMLEHAQRDGVGAVGVKLLYPGGTIQHAGVVLFPFGPDHVYRHHDPDAPSYFDVTSVTRNTLSVTGACVMVSMRNLQLVGGWNENLVLNFNDIDLCFKLVEKGNRIVYTPHVRLWHHESVSKTPDEMEIANIVRECQFFLSFWRDKYPHDPFYNVNLTQEFPYYQIGKLTPAEDMLTGTDTPEDAIAPEASSVDGP